MRTSLRTLAGLTVVVIALLVPAPASMAQDDHEEEAPASTVTTVPGSVGIGDGFSFLGAEITTADEPARELDAMQAAVYVQSWLGLSFFGDVEFQDPPPGLSVYRVDVTGTWGVNTPVGTMVTYFAHDGTNSWISFPQDQQPSPAPIAEPPTPKEWFVATAQTLEGFNGTGDLEDTLGTFNATTTTTTPGSSGSDESASPSGDSDSSSPPWAWIALGAVVVLGGGAFVLRRRRT